MNINTIGTEAKLDHRHLLGESMKTTTNARKDKPMKKVFEHCVGEHLTLERANEWMAGNEQKLPLMSFVAPI